MSNPDQPTTPPLTRRQMRDIRNTGSTPIQAPQDTPEPAPEPVVEPAAPLARAAEPAVVAPAPRPDASVDLGVSPLTRRQAREQERIRTASVPVIAPDVAAAAADSPREHADAAQTPLRAAEAALSEPQAPAATVSDQLGSALLDGPAPEVELPPSFDHLLTRDAVATGAVMTPNALILSQTPTTGFTAPIAATGEILVTGTFELPEGLGSRGHAPGTTDGKDVDAVLVDGELPASSSPTPIAASAAISTIKSADEIIRPPVPEKGSRLMLALAITAGALALALVGVLIIAVTTGLFS